MAIFKDRYSGGNLFKLFTICALPIHIWAIILWLRDAETITARTTVGGMTGIWSTIGVGAYTLVFALFESAVIFLVVLLLSLMLPKRWTEEKRMAQISVGIVIVSLWAMANQIYFLADKGPVVSGVNAPAIIAFIVVLLVIIASPILPFYLIHRYPKIEEAVNMLVDRLSMLSILYLLFDIVGLVIILIRNL